MTISLKIGLAAAMLMTFVGAGQALDVPTLDVSKTCKPLSSDVAIDQDRCYRSEAEAKDQLAKSWSDYTEADRSMCSARATMGGTASYVALITCLEMKRDVARLPPDRGLTTRPSGMPIR